MGGGWDEVDSEGRCYLFSLQGNVDLLYLMVCLLLGQISAYPPTPGRSMGIMSLSVMTPAPALESVPLVIQEAGGRGMVQLAQLHRCQLFSLRGLLPKLLSWSQSIGHRFCQVRQYKA